MSHCPTALNTGHGGGGRYDHQELEKTKPVVYGGDLNVAHLDGDIWNLEAKHIPKSAGTTPEERTAFGQLLGGGFKDSFRFFHPEAEHCYTYWSVRAGNRCVLIYTMFRV